MARTRAQTKLPEQKAPRSIGKTATGKPTSGVKDKVDEAAEGSFPASDPPAGAGGAASGPPTEDISPAKYVDPQKIKRKPR